MNRDEPKGPNRRVWLGIAVISIAISRAGDARAQPLSPTPSPPAAAATPDQELLQEMRALRAEVSEARKLKAQVEKLQAEVTTLRSTSRKDDSARRTETQMPRTGSGPVEGGSTPGGSPTIPSGSLPEPFQGENYRYRSSGSPAPPGFHSPGEDRATGAPSSSGGEVQDNYPLQARYKYNIGTGPLGGGGYTHLSTPDEEFSVNLTNQITVDGTFYDRKNLPTIEKGFNIPFARTFLYGNITKNWKYQIGTQGFLGQFNLLDLWMAYTVSDALTIRFGKGLTPPLYEYYGWTPALEPVITNSPLFQLAGKRQLGVMATGNLFDKRVQYWSGVNNTGTSFFYNLSNNVEYNGAVTLTPFANSDSILKSFGGGVGGSVGYEHFLLNQGNNQAAFINGSGEPTTNSSFINSTGIPFFTYHPNVSSNGMRSRIAPHVFWFGRFSVVAELMNFSRVLTDGTNTGRSTQLGYYVNASYYLTGERDFAGNGFQGYTTTQPLRPFRPGKGQYGPGAWQIAGQFAELNTGTGDFKRGFADTATSTNRLDQVMVGLNWWPNKYTRLSFDYFYSGFNNAIPVNGTNPISAINTYWMRFAMFF